MKVFRSIYFNEMRHDLSWYVYWIIGISLYNFLMLSMYPGEAAMQDFMEILDEDVFVAMLGEIGGESPGFALWIGMFASMTSIIYFIFAIMSGTRVAIKSVDDDTGELIHTLPVNLSKLIFGRWMVSVTFFIILILVWLFPIWIYDLGKTIPLIRLANIFWWTLLFCLAGLALGIILGLITSSMEKGQQNGLLGVLSLYALQMISRLQEDFAWMDDFNILSWYEPTGLFLRNKIIWEMVVKLVIITTVMMWLVIQGFSKKDLIKDAGLSIPPLISNFSSRFRKKKPTKRVKFKSDKNSFYTFWVRPLEKKFPFTADFIYSEKRVLLITFIGIIIMWPLQLLSYSEDVATAAGGFGSGGIMRLFTYNHDILDRPWLWFLITQAIGNHWFFFLPLSIFWINKIVKRDGETMTGEIMGSVPINSQKVVFERFFAVLLEIIWMIIWMIFWLVISEMAVGQTINLAWEVIAIISLFPLYYFLISMTISISLLVKEKGVLIARSTIFALFLLWIMAIMNDNLDRWYVKLFFGMYDPVLIITEQSISVQNYGIPILILLSILSTPLLIYASRYYQWIDMTRGRETQVD